MNINGCKKENYKEMTKNEKNNPFLSNTFKLWVVAIIFFLVFLHFYVITKYPQSNIVSDRISLTIVLVLVVYLWIQEFRDRHRLHLLNKALMNAQEELERAEIDTISVLILTEEAKDPYVRGHSKRVAQYSLAIAKGLGLPKERQKIIERSGILHDLGKLGIADTILKKPGKLNDEEWKIMKEHPRRAIEILKPLKFLSADREIILHHHERYDGGGYPDGLKGEAIPFESRIIAVADTFDAMNSERPYRKSLPKDVIISELKENFGIQLDSSVVTIFLSLLEKNPRLWEKD